MRYERRCELRRLIAGAAANPQGEGYFFMKDVSEEVGALLFAAPDLAEELLQERDELEMALTVLAASTLCPNCHRPGISVVWGAEEGVEVRCDPCGAEIL